jgi:hypothetical protein
VAHDINTAEAIWCNKAIVEVVGLPAYSCWDWVLVLQGSVPALVAHAIGNDFFDVPMGKSESGQECEDKGLHCGGLKKIDRRDLLDERVLNLDSEDSI